MYEPELTDRECSKLLEEFYRRQHRTACTCRPMIKNRREVIVTASGRYGCKVHCDHYGININARQWRCACGAGTLPACASEMREIDRIIGPI